MMIRFFLGFVLNFFSLSLFAESVSPSQETNFEDLPHAARSIHSYGALFPWWVVFISCFFCLLTFIAFWSYKKFWKKRGALIVAKDLPLEVRQKISSLEPTENFSRKDQINFFYELSFNFRYYIELKTGLQATDLTFKELRPLLRERLKNSGDKSLNFLKFFEKAEYIKFADKEATKEEARRDRENVLEFLSFLDELVRSEKEIEKKKEERKGGTGYAY